MAAWALQVCGNGLAAAGPLYGFNVRNGTSHGYTFTFAAVTFFYISMASCKTAFAMTLIRVSSGKTTALLWFLTLVTWAFGLSGVIVTWLPICGQQTDSALGTACVAYTTLIWVHTGNAIATLCTDTTLAAVPWSIVQKVYIPSKEKWAVATSMSLVGLAAIICIAR